MDIEKMTQRSRYTAEEKDELTQLFIANGIEVPTKRSCNDCWRDAVIMLYRKMRGDRQRRKWLKGDARFGCWFRGVYVSDDTMNEETKEKLDKMGFPKHLWEDEQ